MSNPRISYVDPASVDDPAMRAELERCAREGTPRPESQAVRAHVPAMFWSFANTWSEVFHNGVADHNIKELCRIYVSRSVLCEFCGNQRSIKAAKAGLIEDDYIDLINFEIVDELRRAAESGARLHGSITWDLPATDALWARLHKHFSEPELVEIGYFVAHHHGPAALAAHPQHRAPPDSRRSPTARWRRASRRSTSSSESKQATDYWAKVERQAADTGGRVSRQRRR